jgi:hypothetical protein
MTIIKKSESFPVRPVVILLYGQPGAGKTSVFNTSKNPILLDCDRGSDRACTRAEATIIASNWKDVLADEHEIKNFSTIGIDTAKSVLDDFLMTYVAEQDYKLKTNKLKAYGAIGDEFKVFINRRRGENIDIVILAHAKEEKDGDVTRFSPDVTGGSKDLLLRIADQVGYVYMSNNKRTINFNPTDKTIGKNVARIPEMEIPDESDLKYLTFMADIIDKVKTSIQSMSQAQIDAIAETERVRELISAINTLDQAQSVSEEIGKLPKAQQIAFRTSFSAKLVEAKIKFDKESKKFIYDEA